MQTKGTVAVMWQIFGKYKWHVAALILLGLMSAVLEGIGINAAIPLVSFFTGGSAATQTDFISHTIAKLFALVHISFTFRYLLVFVLGMFFLRAVSVVVFGYIRGWITGDFTNSESQDLLQKVLHSSWPFLLSQKMGHVQGTLIRDVQRTGSLLEAFSQLIQSWTGFLMYLVIAANISLTMTAMAILGGAVLFMVVRPLMLRTLRVWEKLSALEKHVSQFIGEHVLGMKSIKAAGMEDVALARGKELLQTQRTLYIRQMFVRSLSSSLFQPFSLVFVIVLFAVTYKTPGFSIISFAAALYLIQKVFTYLESGQASLHAVSELLPYAKNIAEFKDALVVAKENIKEGSKPFSLKEGIEFVHVRFGYAGGEDVLKDVHLHIKKGSTVGLIGPSGAGKTSVADILLRLFEPTGGEILIDGQPLQEISLLQWRSHIGYVSQDVFLLNDTIEANIRFYRDNLTHEDIVSAVRQANLYEFIESLPQGLDTVVGDRGVMLSGGQRQRIALARALVGRPELLILDEATSALDTESEKLIQQSIEALHGHITVLIIAHRLSTVDSADTIVVLNSGVVVEYGPPQELLKNPESYFTRSRGTRA